MSEENKMSKAAVDYWSKNGRLRKSRLPELKRLRDIVDEKNNRKQVAHLDGYLELAAERWGPKTRELMSAYHMDLAVAAAAIPNVKLDLHDAGDIVQLNLLDSKNKPFFRYPFILLSMQESLKALIEKEDDIFETQLINLMTAIGSKSGIEDPELIRSSFPESFWEEVDAIGKESTVHILENLCEVSAALESVEPRTDFDLIQLSAEEEERIKETVSLWVDDDGHLRDQQLQKMLERLSEWNKHPLVVPSEMEDMLEMLDSDSVSTLPGRDWNLEQLSEYCQEIEKRLPWVSLVPVEEGRFLDLTDRRPEHKASQILPASGLTTVLEHILKSWPQPKKLERTVDQFKEDFAMELDVMLDESVSADLTGYVLADFPMTFWDDFDAAATNLVYSMQELLTDTLAVAQQLDEEWVDC